MTKCRSYGADPEREVKFTLRLVAMDRDKFCARAKRKGVSLARWFRRAAHLHAEPLEIDANTLSAWIAKLSTVDPWVNQVLMNIGSVELGMTHIKAVRKDGGWVFNFQREI